TQIPLERIATMSASETHRLERMPAAACTALEARGGKELPIPAGDPGKRVRTAQALSSDGARLEPAAYVVRPVADGPLSKVVSGREEIALHRSEGSRRTFARILWNELAGGDDPPTRRRLSEEAVYFRVPSMNPPVYANVEAERSSWPRPNGKERLLIVDLR